MSARALLFSTPRIGCLWISHFRRPAASNRSIFCDVVGVFLPADPGCFDENAKEGKIAIDYGLQWLKGQSMGSGQCPVKKYNRQLRDLIAVGKAKPSWIVSHEIPLSKAADAYKNFNDRTNGWTKVILKPE